MQFPSLAAFGLALALLAPSATAQTTWYVDVANTSPGTGTQTDPYSSIQAAVDAATTLDGDLLSVALGDYPESVDFAGKAITIEGQADASGTQYPVIKPPTGTGVLIASGEGPGSVLRHMRINGGSGTLINSALTGGGILIRNSSPTFQDVVVRNSDARRGGGIAIIEGAAPSFEQVTVRACHAKQGGGVLIENASLNWDGGILLNNQTYSYGFQNSPGGGLASLRSSVTLRNLDVLGNGSQGASVEGGGVYCGPNSTLEVFDTQFTDQVASFGGAGFGPAVYTRCAFDANLAYQSGGAIYGGTALDCHFDYNRSKKNGGAASWSQLSGCLLERNYNNFFVTTGPGGGAFMSDLVDCVVQNNRAIVGGGIYGGSALRTVFIDNRVSVLSGVGGVGGAAALADLEHCEFFGNRAQRGAAVWLGGAPAGYPSAGPGSATHCTFSRNPTRGTSSTPYNETMFLGALAGPVTHCIFEFSRKADITAPMGGDVTWCCLGKAFPGIGNFVASPMLASQIAYDAHLLPASPCIDAGDPSAPLDPDGSVVDIGARAFDPAYTTEPVLFCPGVIYSSSCPANSTTNMTGHLSGSGVGQAVYHVDGLESATLGFLSLGLNAYFTPIVDSANLCVSTMRRVGPMQVSVPSSNCTGTLDFPIPSAEVFGLAGTLVYVQAVLKPGIQWRTVDAYELLVQQ
jgi:predicted outer membrane repeat protein